MSIRRWSIAQKIWAFSAYALIASTLCAALMARYTAGLQAQPLSFYLLWQGLIYAAWVPAALIVWIILARSGRDSAAIMPLVLTSFAIVPVQALIATALDIRFVGGGDFSNLVPQAIDRFPVSLLLWTALSMTGLAFLQYSRAQQARSEARVMAKALRDASNTLKFSAPQRLLVTTGQRKVPVLLSDIEWFGSAGNYVVVHWQDREGLLRTPLKTLENELDPVVFARSHRSTLINLAMVRATQPLSDGSWRPTMQSGTELVLSRTYRDDILKRLDAATMPAPSNP